MTIDLPSTVAKLKFVAARSVRVRVHAVVVPILRRKLRAPEV